MIMEQIYMFGLNAYSRAQIHDALSPFQYALTCSFDVEPIRLIHSL